MTHCKKKKHRFITRRFCLAIIPVENEKYFVTFPHFVGAMYLQTGDTTSSSSWSTLAFVKRPSSAEITP